MVLLGWCFLKNFLGKLVFLPKSISPFLLVFLYSGSQGLGSANYLTLLPSTEYPLTNSVYALRMKLYSLILNNNFILTLSLNNSSTLLTSFIKSLIYTPGPSHK